MSKKNPKYMKPLKDDDIAQTLAAMLSESSEDDDEGEEFGCRDGPYPDFDINKALDKVEDSFSLEELKGILESNSSKSSEFAPCCDTAAPETRKRSASKLHPCDQITSSVSLSFQTGKGHIETTYFFLKGQWSNSDHMIFPIKKKEIPIFFFHKFILYIYRNPNPKNYKDPDTFDTRPY